MVGFIQTLIVLKRAAEAQDYAANALLKRNKKPKKTGVTSS